MKKINKLQLTKTSYLLVIASSISLFLLVVFFSYSLYGERGTYSKEIVQGSACASYGFSCYKCTDPYTLDSNFKWYTAYEADTSQCNPTNPGDCANSTCAVDCDGVIDNDGICSANKVCNACGSSQNGYYVWGAKKPGCSVVEVEESLCHTYTVTFNPDGGIIEGLSAGASKEIKVNAGKKVTPPEVVKSEYRFTGWFWGTDEHTTSFNFNDAINGDKTLIAHWEKNNLGSGTGCYRCYGSHYPEEAFWAADNPDSNYCSLAGSESDCTNYVCWKHDNVTYSSTFAWSNSRPGSDYYIVDESECSSITRYYVTLYQNKYNWKSGSDPKKVEYDDRMDITDFPALDTTDNVVWSKNADCSGTPISSHVDAEENGKKLYACPKSSGGNPGYVPPSDGGNPGNVPSNGGDNNTGNGDNNQGSDDDNNKQATNPGVAFSDEINGDRCYKGKWVRVVKCQPASISGAQCQLKDETLVLRKGDGLTTYSGCSELPDPYTDVIDDYRCDKSSGKWIYISSCQSSDLIGAQCKETDGKIIRTYLTLGYGCSSSKPGSSNGGTSGGGNNDVNNPKTGTTEVIVSILVAAVALFVSWYYFKKNKVIEG